jgi:hypothetical protein
MTIRQIDIRTLAFAQMMGFQLFLYELISDSNAPTGETSLNMLV